MSCARAIPTMRLPTARGTGAHKPRNRRPTKAIGVEAMRAKEKLTSAKQAFTVREQRKARLGETVAAANKGRHAVTMISASLFFRCVLGRSSMLSTSTQPA